MRIHQDLAATIGNTPQSRLKRASEITGCTILGKCAFMNPGQSVKDRAALYIIRDAVAKGLLKPGGTLAGVALALQPKGGKIGLDEVAGGDAHRFGCATPAEAADHPAILNAALTAGTQNRVVTMEYAQ